MRRNKYSAPRHTQKGITLVLVSLVLLILLGAAAFGIDLNHQVLNKTRLQNAVDSAALAAAVVADERTDTANLSERLALATQAANDALTHFAASDGNQEMVFGVGGGQVSVTFSNDNQTFGEAGTFTLGTDGDIYIRVAVSDVPLTQYLSFIFGFDKAVSASAVAGPSADIISTCNVSPVAMCGDVASAELAWGYVPASNPDYNGDVDRNADTIHVLKPSGHKDGGIGAGNYHLLDFGSGKNTVREMLAGDTDECLTVGDLVTTETGKGTGPVAQGLNTRFDGGKPKEGITSDKYIEESNVTYENYQQQYQDAEDPAVDNDAFYYADYVEGLAACTGGSGTCKSQYYREDGKTDRRVLRVPIVRCDTAPKKGGKMDLEVLGIGCFFVTQQVQNKGNESEIYGQFLEDCTVKNASTGVDPDDDGIGPYKIVLYKDPLSGGS
ncbi:pilus assembly protein TadG-related protein [Vibrio alginolyticus]|uniref:pilus assembly protein TadG-related protein n=1 Tax=Vibrio TaxID=662 RepID=UPI001BD50649|nr:MULTISPECIES: pilus assembly protein TadG-related protein [Vibrio]MBS9933405.1 hypothetical protein [Vibrio alginolyticus]MBT0107556.1 hypothetical protein [Vibrio alginolyticus]